MPAKKTSDKKLDIVLETLESNKNELKRLRKHQESMENRQHTHFTQNKQWQAHRNSPYKKNNYKFGKSHYAYSYSSSNNHPNYPNYARRDNPIQPNLAKHDSPSYQHGPSNYAVAGNSKSLGSSLSTFSSSNQVTQAQKDIDWQVKHKAHIPYGSLTNDMKKLSNADLPNAVPPANLELDKVEKDTALAILNFLDLTEKSFDFYMPRGHKVDGLLICPMYSANQYCNNDKDPEKKFTTCRQINSEGLTKFYAHLCAYCANRFKIAQNHPSNSCYQKVLRNALEKFTTPTNHTEVVVSQVDTSVVSAQLTAPTVSTQNELVREATTKNLPPTEDQSDVDKVDYTNKIQIQLKQQEIKHARELQEIKKRLESVQENIKKKKKSITPKAMKRLEPAMDNVKLNVMTMTTKSPKQKRKSSKTLDPALDADMKNIKQTDEFLAKIEEEEFPENKPVVFTDAIHER